MTLEHDYGRLVKALTDALPYSYNPKTNRYYHTTSKKMVKFADVLTAFDAKERFDADRLFKLSKAYQSGDVTFAVWHRVFLNNLRSWHIQQAALGAGGLSQLRVRDFTQIEAILDLDVDRLRKFAESIPEMGDGQLQFRINLYLGNGRREYWHSKRLPARAYQPGWFTIERRKIRPGDNCEWCIYLADAGWQPHGVLPYPGDIEQSWYGHACLTNCRCKLDRRYIKEKNIPKYVKTPLLIQPFKKSFEKAYDPDQPRHPKGSPRGGQFAGTTSGFDAGFDDMVLGTEDLDKLFAQVNNRDLNREQEIRNFLTQYMGQGIVPKPPSVDEVLLSFTAVEKELWSGMDHALAQKIQAGTWTDLSREYRSLGISPGFFQVTTADGEKYFLKNLIHASQVRDDLNCGKILDSFGLPVHKSDAFFGTVSEEARPGWFVAQRWIENTDWQTYSEVAYLSRKRVPQTPFDSFKEFPMEDRIAFLAADFIVGNDDRHNGNALFSTKPESGNPILLIDNGRVGSGRGQNGPVFDPTNIYERHLRTARITKTPTEFMLECAELVKQPVPAAAITRIRSWLGTDVSYLPPYQKNFVNESYTFMAELLDNAESGKIDTSQFLLALSEGHYNSSAGIPREIPVRHLDPVKDIGLGPDDSIIVPF